MLEWLMLGHAVSLTNMLSVVIDSRDPAWSVVRALPCVTGRLAVVVLGDIRPDARVPIAFP